MGQWYGVPPGYVPESLEVEEHRTPSSPRWLSQAAFDLRIPRLLAREGHDMVWTRNVAAALWCTRAGLPTVFETYRPDIATDWRFAPWRRAVLGSRHLRGVIHHSATADEAFARAGVPASRRLVARNGYAPIWMEPRLDRSVARAVLNLPLDRPLVVYAGDVHPSKGIATLLRMAATVPEALVLMIGAADDARRQEVQELANTGVARNVVVRLRVPVGQLAPYLYAADCLVIPPPAEPMERSRTVLPLKVFLYLAAGRAILAPRRPDLEEVLVHDLTARLVPPGDDEAWTAALRAILEDEWLRERLGKKALAASERYTWSARAQQIVQFLETIAR